MTVAKIVGDYVTHCSKTKGRPASIVAELGDGIKVGSSTCSEHVFLNHDPSRLDIFRGEPRKRPPLQSGTTTGRLSSPCLGGRYVCQTMHSQSALKPGLYRDLGRKGLILTRLLSADVRFCSSMKSYSQRMQNWT